MCPQEIKGLDACSDRRCATVVPRLHNVARAMRSCSASMSDVMPVHHDWSRCDVNHGGRSRVEASDDMRARDPSSAPPVRSPRVDDPHAVSIRPDSPRRDVPSPSIRRRVEVDVRHAVDVRRRCSGRHPDPSILVGQHPSADGEHAGALDLGWRLLHGGRRSRRLRRRRRGRGCSLLTRVRRHGRLLTERGGRPDRERGNACERDERLFPHDGDRRCIGRANHPAAALAPAHAMQFARSRHTRTRGPK